ncbi:FAD-binding oxidoreductase [Rhizobiaceae bacterium BDR2-2]|uniref:FAD-binding oxidoreductase n=1 Tax=Ectorhizobium quercum TaxID=2965071 RepID=A0AAE3SV03_9HYPH|nr:FAD-binding and (Fe-S)-binding domain-containing protein [Ectorhizobium quercum]MCX8997238.1 FAD-binding oxidoreductase [Ectorhizobium quercum]
MQIKAPEAIHRLADALAAEGFGGEIETNSALRAAMSTDNSVYQIFPDLIVSPRGAADLVTLLAVLERPEFDGIGLTARGGGTGTNGQSLNRGVIVDMRRHMNRLIAVDVAGQWAEVEPGIVLDDLNEQLRPHGLFFAPETSTSTRCTVGGMVSTDASGKGSRVYGKTSDNIAGMEIARPEGLLASFEPAPAWAAPMLEAAEASARAGRDAFIANTPRLNRRFTGYDLERACRENGDFEWWRLFLGAEGTLGLMSRIRVKLRRIEAEKRLIVAGFSSFREALASATPLLADGPTAIEVMDEWVQKIAGEAGILSRLPPALRPEGGARVAYVFIEFNGDDAALLERRLAACRDRLATLPGIGAIHVAQDLAEIRELWAIRSAGVGLLGKVDGRARPVAFVEDCVVPPENLPAFLDEFLAVLTAHGLGFGIYGHVDVGCLHIRPALDIDAEADRAKLVSVSDAVYGLTRKYGGIFWGEHGKGVRGAYLADWIGPDAYRALQGVKAAFDPRGRFNPGKLVSPRDDIMGIATTNFRPFNGAAGDALEKAFRCNGNAQCLSYAAATPMCPSFKASADVRHSPKGRADALRAWKAERDGGTAGVDEADLLGTLDTCLGCKACASTCPVQVDIPQMRTAFYADYYARNARPFADRITLLAERLSPLQVMLAPLARPVWPLLRALSQWLMDAVDLPDAIAQPLPASARIAAADLGRAPLPDNAVLVWQDWFTALFDEAVQRDALSGLTALGYRPLFVEMLPAGKAALNFGDLAGFRRLATPLADALKRGAATGAPMIGLDPAFVMMLRQDYPKAGQPVPEVLLPQEFLVRDLKNGRTWPKAGNGVSARLLSHCTEATAQPKAGAMWAEVFAALGVTLSTPATGCCGMAGLFGHQKRHQTVSLRLFDLSWKKHADAGAEPLLATGFSCRCQTERLADREARHPLGLIGSLLTITEK